MYGEQITAMDPFILLSWTNMKLRDEAGNLDELCDSYGLDKENLQSRLKSVGYRYNSKTNQFVVFDDNIF